MGTHSNVPKQLEQHHGISLYRQHGQQYQQWQHLPVQHPSLAQQAVPLGAYLEFAHLQQCVICVVTPGMRTQEKQLCCAGTICNFTYRHLLKFQNDLVLLRYVGGDFLVQSQFSDGTQALDEHSAITDFGDHLFQVVLPVEDKKSSSAKALHPQYAFGTHVGKVDEHRAAHTVIPEKLLQMVEIHGIKKVEDNIINCSRMSNYNASEFATLDCADAQTHRCLPP
jgi:hypothetical protein